MVFVPCQVEMPHPHLAKVPRVTGRRERERERGGVYSTRFTPRVGVALFVKIDSVVMLSSGVATATRVLPVFACGALSQTQSFNYHGRRTDPTVPMRNMAAQLPRFLQPRNLQKDREKDLNPPPYGQQTCCKVRMETDTTSTYHLPNTRIRT